MNRTLTPPWLPARAAERRAAGPLRHFLVAAWLRFVDQLGRRQRARADDLSLHFVDTALLRDLGIDRSALPATAHHPTRHEPPWINP